MDVSEDQGMHLESDANLHLRILTFVLGIYHCSWLSTIQLEMQEYFSRTDETGEKLMAVTLKYIGRYILP